MPRSDGGIIARVLPGSIGGEIGLEPGDRLVAINGHPLRDVIDYRYYGADEELLLEVVRDDERHHLEVERDYDEELGLEFTEPVFDGMRQCVNRCPFCFVRQMPPGLRPSLYVRDDDYRYSFLQGSFITLTNLTEADWHRIGEQRLSPLYVSIHATDLAVRRTVLGNPRAPDLVVQLRRLGSMGIVVHGQVVVWPGVNDGAALDRTIEEVGALWPTVRTLAIVPVGLTRYQQREPATPVPQAGPKARPCDVRLVTPNEARDILDRAGRWREALRGRVEGTWLYPSDELYLLAGQRNARHSVVPPASFYDTDAQRENGVGLVRELLDDGRRARRRARPGMLAGRHATLACGTLIAPTLSDMASGLAARTGALLEVVAVPNRLFGETVTVSGLLAGADLVTALAGRDLGERVLVPRAMFEAEGRLTLDDMTVEGLEHHLGVPATPVSLLSEVLEVLSRGV
jgi:putative radical SAM enzyme (TIGR03279 family)